MIPRKYTAKDLWQPKRRIEVMYKRTLKQLVNSINKVLKGVTNTNEIIRILKKVANSKEFKKYAERSAMKMVTSLFSDAGHTWREAAKANSKGKHIYEALKKELNGPIGTLVNEQIQRNADLIKSVPLDMAKEITDYVSKEAFKGRTPKSIADDLQEKIPIISTKKANLIARTEVSKTNTALIKARSENIGIMWYEWCSCKDQRVRSSHSHMNGVLVNWDYPPSPELLIRERNVGNYHAGNIYNCRCFPAPVILLDMLNWPCKVYRSGKIQSMTRKQFEEIM